MNRGAAAEADGAALRAELDACSQHLLDLERRLSEGHEDHDRSFRRLSRVARKLIALGGEADTDETFARLAQARRQARVANPPTARPVPEGWEAGAPDFVGLGVQRSGTSWWFDRLTAHPEVFCPRRKEVHYFDSFSSCAISDQQVEGYHAWFPRPGEGAADQWPEHYVPEPGEPTPRARLAGEWTPRYLSNPFVPRLLTRAAPDARLLAIVRDPVERYRSAISWTDARPKGTAGQPAYGVPAGAFTLGDYHTGLTQLLRHFPRSQVLLLQYEACVAEPQAHLRRTFAFLGLQDVDFQPGDNQRQVNVKFPQMALDPAVREELIGRYADGVRALAELFPQEIDLDLWPNFQ